MTQVGDVIANTANTTELSNLFDFQLNTRLRAGAKSF